MYFSICIPTYNRAKLIIRTLKSFYELCKKIENNSEYNGVMGRCVDIKTGKLIGELFKEDIIIRIFYKNLFSFYFCNI